MKQNAIIVDLDGTLCNCEHRVKYVDGSLGKKDWDKFYEGIVDDEPNEWCRWLLESFDAFVEPAFLFVTGRPEKYRDITLAWFREKLNGLKHEIADHKGYPRLYMRQDNDHRPDYVIKEEIYNERIKDEFHVLLAIDDRQQVIDMWRRIGIPALQCAKGDF